MAEDKDWEFPASLQPGADDVGFDLDQALASVVGLRAEIPEDAFTAGILGTERAGNGVVIGENGVVLTIGYLITEAQSVWLSTIKGTAVPGHPLAYDQTTGFGLVQALGRLGLPAIRRGTADSCAQGQRVILAGHGGRRHALKARVLAKKEFAGYWEYVLDEAIFTAPAHPHWGGAALLDHEGRLAGIGSLLVQERVADKDVQGNMVVPIDLLEPILDDLLRFGRVNQPPKPWLGMYTAEIQGHLVVAGLAQGGPAHKAGIEIGDVVLEVAGEPLGHLADLYRKVWKRGPAGVEVVMTVGRDGARQPVRVRTVDRSEFLKKPKLH